MAKATSKVRKGEVDIERMAAEQKISFRTILKHLGLSPSGTAEEAGRTFARARGADRAEALRHWASLCATPQDFWKLYVKTRSSEWDLVRKQLVPKWIESWEEALTAADSFDSTYLLSETRPRNRFTDQEVLERQQEHSLAELLVKKLLGYFETADQGTKIYEIARYQQILGDDFKAKWVELCQTPDEIEAAFKACQGGIKSLALKRFDICTNPDALKRAYGKSRHHGNREDRNEIEAAYIRKMAEFYRK